MCKYHDWTISRKLFGIRKLRREEGPEIFPENVLKELISTPLWHMTSCISGLMCLHLSTDDLTQSSAIFLDLCDFPDVSVQQRVIVYGNSRQILCSSPTCRVGPTNFITLISQKLFLFGTLPFSLLSSSSLSSFKSTIYLVLTFVLILLTLL